MAGVSQDPARSLGSVARFSSSSELWRCLVTLSALENAALGEGALPLVSALILSSVRGWY